MIRENVSTQETVTVQLIKGVAPVASVGDVSESGCGLPSITLERVVQGVSVKQSKGEANDNNN